MRKPLKVSVCVITYNQEEYIGRCLQSLVEQETDFPFEIIVGDDCSTDATWQVVLEYAGRFPNLIRPYRHATNLKGTNNYLFVHNKARGEYVAHMDGDDVAYPDKLKTQAYMLDCEPEAAFATHDVDVIDKQGTLVRSSFSGPNPEKTELTYLLSHGCFFTHSSKMYRRSAAVERVSSDVHIVDFQFHLEMASSGSILWSPRKLGAYRAASGIASDPSWSEWQDEAYEAAFRQALLLGIDPLLVNESRLRHRYKTAVTALRHKQYRRFQRLIRLTSDDRHVVSLRHKTLAALAPFAPLISPAAQAYLAFHRIRHRSATKS